MMTSIINGHNNPPADARLSMDIDELFSTLSATLAGEKIDSDEKEAAIDEMLGEFKKLKKSADDERKAEKKPHDDAGKAVQEKWKPIIAKAERGEADCSKALTPYRSEKLRKAEAAAQKAREEAAELEAAAQKALRESDDLEEKFEAEQKLEAAQKQRRAANRIDRAPKGVRTYYEAEITNRRDALNYYIKQNPQAFEDLIQSLADEDARNEGTRGDKPGIVFHKREKAI